MSDYTIHIHHSFSQLTPKVSSDLYELILPKMSYMAPNYWRTPRFKRGVWDGRIRLFKKRAQKFPSGLLHRLINLFERECISYEIDDQRTCPSPGIPEEYVCDWSLGGGWEPRGYQDMAVTNGVLQGRGVFNIGTGGGKTGIAAALWKALDSPLGAVFVPRKLLMHQIANEFEARLPEDVHIGRVGDGLFDIGDVTVAVINSCFPPTEDKKYRSEKRVAKWETILTWLHSLEFFFSDECHLIGNNLWYNILMECDNAYYRFAGSGTPFGRGEPEKHLLISATGPTLINVPYSRLRDEGWVCETTVYAVPYKMKGHLENLDYSSAYSQMITHNEERMFLVVDIIEELREGRTPLVLVTIISHGEAIEAVLRDAGLAVKFISGSTSSKKRDEALADLQSGTLDVLVASGILDTGLDLPDLSLIVNAGGGKAETKAIQKVGRGVRKSKGKSDLIYVDILDNSNSYLRSHAKGRLDIYERDGYPVKVYEPTRRSR